MGIFCLTCKPQAQAISKFSARLGEPAAAIGQTLSSALPSLDLVPKLSHKTTVLLMGVDSNGLGADPFLGTRTDTMMLVSIDPPENKVGVISIPRDSRVYIPNHGIDKVNSAHAIGGADLARQTVSTDFGIPVDHYIEIDTGGLKKLFEILGPVEVLVEKEMHYVDHSAKLTVDLQPGLQMLSPDQAEQYVRFRNDGRGDIGRIERQQWFVRQAVKKFKDPQIVIKLPDLVNLAYQCVRTDLSVQDALSIALFARDFPHEKVVTAMLPGDARYIGGGSYWVPDAAASQVMFSRILGFTVPVIEPASQPVESRQIAGLEKAGLPNAVSPTGQIASAPGGTSANTSTLPCDYTKPPAVAIKYARGGEQMARAVSDQLTQAGFKIKYCFPVAAADCQHDLLVQQSLRATDEVTRKIYQMIPEMQSFPLSLAIESRPATDFTITISPESQMPSICNSLSALPSMHQKAPPLNANAFAVPLLPQE